MGSPPSSALSDREQSGLVEQPGGEELKLAEAQVVALQQEVADVRTEMEKHQRFTEQRKGKLAGELTEAFMWREGAEEKMLEMENQIRFADN